MARAMFPTMCIIPGLLASCLYKSATRDQPIHREILVLLALDPVPLVPQLSKPARETSPAQLHQLPCGLRATLQGLQHPTGPILPFKRLPARRRPELQPALP